MKRIEVSIDLRNELVAVGTLTGRGSGRSQQAMFSYHASYLGRADAYALDPMLPLHSGIFTTPVGWSMFGAFRDVAPDEWGRRIIVRASERNLTDERTSEIDFIIGVRDDMRQGNIRFLEIESGTLLASSSGAFPPVVSLPILLAATEELDANNPSDLALEELLRAGSSMGGARPKAAVVDDSGALHLAKFPRASTDQWDVNAWEHVACELARRSGINTAHSQLLQIAEQNVLLVQRFDRSGEKRIGYASAMTMLEANVGEPCSYIEIAEVITEHGLQVNRDLEELWRRIAFSIAISNTDDHLRNHGFLRDPVGNGWNLSPVFDINPEPRGKIRLLSTPIRPGRHEADIRILLEEAERFRLSIDRSMQIINQVNDAVSQWGNIADAVSIDPKEQQMMSKAFRQIQIN